MPRTLLSLLTPLAVCLCTALAAAQEGADIAAPPGEPGAGDAALAEPEETPWIIRVDPTVWWMSPTGDLRLPRSTGTTPGDSVRLDLLNMDTPEFTPAGSVSINAGDFRFSFFGAGYSRDGDAHAEEPIQIGDVDLDTGDAFETEFDLGIFELAGGYRFYTYDWHKHSADPEKCIDVSVDLYALLGTRLYDMNIGVSRFDGMSAASSGTEQFFGDVIAGVRAELMILRDFNINVQLDGGGMADSDRSSFSFNIQIAGEWRPWENVGVQVGWRHIQYTFEDGDGAGKFEYDGSVAGVYAGVMIRF